MQLAVVESKAYAKETIMVWWWFAWIIYDSRPEIDKLNTEVPINNNVFILDITYNKGKGQYVADPIQGRQGTYGDKCPRKQDNTRLQQSVQRRAVRVPLAV